MMHDLEQIKFNYQNVVKFILTNLKFNIKNIPVRFQNIRNYIFNFSFTLTWKNSSNIVFISARLFKHWHAKVSIHFIHVSKLVLFTNSHTSKWRTAPSDALGLKDNLYD